MNKALFFALIIMISSSCATGRQTDSGQDPPLSAVLDVTSEPSGAAVALMVDNLDPKTREQTPCIKTGKHGITPCQLDIEQGKIGRYFIEFIKEGYRTEICKITAEVELSHSKQKVGKAIETVGNVLISPALWLVAGALQSSGPSKSLKLTPNPLNVVLKPAVEVPSSKDESK